MEQMARGVGGRARVRGCPDQAQRLDGGTGGGTEDEQNSPADSLWSEQDAVQNIYQVQGGGGEQ